MTSSLRARHDLGRSVTVTAVARSTPIEEEHAEAHQVSSAGQYGGPGRRRSAWQSPDGRQHRRITHVPVGPPRPHRLLGGQHGLAQAQGLQDKIAHGALPDLPGEPFDESTEDDEAGVRVGERRTEWDVLPQLCTVLDETGHGVVPGSGVLEEITRDAAGVGEQMPSGDPPGDAA